MRSFFRDFVVIGVIIMAALWAASPGSKASKRTSDEYIFSRTVKLSSKRGSCSGTQIKAPSGFNYILSAGHCDILVEDGKIWIETDAGLKLKRNIVAEDEKSDLLLVEGLPGVEGLKIANMAYERQSVKTYTSGKGFHAYKTEGILMQDKKIDILLGMSMEGSSSAFICPDFPKIHKETLDSLFGTIEACVLTANETATTAMTVPGSSGGLVADEHGAMIGVVSAGGDGFGFLVTLADIHAFLRNY